MQRLFLAFADKHSPPFSCFASLSPLCVSSQGSWLHVLHQTGKAHLSFTSSQTRDCARLACNNPPAVQVVAMEVVLSTRSTCCPYLAAVLMHNATLSKQHTFTEQQPNTDIPCPHINSAAYPNIKPWQGARRAKPGLACSPHQKRRSGTGYDNLLVSGWEPLVPSLSHLRLLSKAQSGSLSSVTRATSSLSIPRATTCLRDPQRWHRSQSSRRHRRRNSRKD